MKKNTHQAKHIAFHRRRHSFFRVSPTLCNKKKTMHRKLRVVPFCKKAYQQHRSGWKFVSQLMPKNTCQLAQPQLEFYEMLEFDVVRRRTRLPARKLAPHWIGISHLTWRVNAPKDDDGSNTIDETLLIDTLFEKSLHIFKSCVAVIVFSKHCARLWRAAARAHGLSFNVYVIAHPTDICATRFDVRAFLDNANKTLYQIGSQLRRVDAIAHVRYDNKCWLPGREPERVAALFESQPKLKADLQHVSIEYLDDQNYDNALSCNIVLLDVLDASANNTVIECMVRGTPLLARRHPAIAEYLGRDYPFFFDTFEEASEKAANVDLIVETAHYMARMFRLEWQNALSGNVFQEKIAQITDKAFECIENKRQHSSVRF